MGHLPQMRSRLLALALVSTAAFTAAPAAFADEGMWLLNDLPVDMMRTSVGAAPDATMVQKLQRGALRLANGCSASFVSPDGLVMTNHHCVRSCLEDLSVGAKDYLSKPFFAKTTKDEVPCTKFELNQLQQIDDVSPQVLNAIKGRQGAAFADALKAVKSQIESACSAGNPNVRCDVVTLFDGAVFHLYKQRRFQDVRLVMAPEFSMAIFGGDPDNFNFPRTGFDVGFLRVYEGNAPLRTADALRFAATPARDGDPVYVVGHPGGTERDRTVAQLSFQRDVALPWTLIRLAELRGRLDEWMQADKKRAVRGKARLRSVENGLKALRGRHQTLAAPGFMDGRKAAEDVLRRSAGPVSKAAFVDVEEANRVAAEIWADYRLLEAGEAFMGDLFAHARHLVRARAELNKADTQRLPEYTSARLPALRQELGNNATIVLDDELALFAWSLHRLRNLKGLDDANVRMLLGTLSPETVAKTLLSKTPLKDPKVRLKALDGDVATWKKLDEDPLMRFAAVIDGPARAARARWENEVEAKETAAGEVLATLRRTERQKQGNSAKRVYPDATFSLRLSYGRVAGTRTAPAMTTVGDLFARAADEEPFKLAPTWLKARTKLTATAGMNISTTNDIIGGNSGSPMLNPQGEVVGLVFDGNLPSLGGRYVYDPEFNRAVAVHADAILSGLQYVYGAERLVTEIQSTP